MTETMKISELIMALNGVKGQYGDIRVFIDDGDGGFWPAQCCVTPSPSDPKERILTL